MSNVAIIIEVLELLRRQSASDASFVIFEHDPSGKFVQFCGSLEEPLQLDLPAQTLSEAEFYRTAAFFKRLGIAGEEYDCLDKPGGVPVFRQFSFQMFFESVSRAAHVALGVFTQVYRFPADCQLTITKGWLPESP